MHRLVKTLNLLHKLCQNVNGMNEHTLDANVNTIAWPLELSTALAQI